MKRSVLIMLLLASAAVMTKAQQVADTAYKPQISNPAYAPDKGPLVFIDEGHWNFHTRNDR